MSDQCTRGLEDHPTELARIRSVEAKLTQGNSSIGQDETSGLGMTPGRDNGLEQAKMEESYESLPDYDAEPDGSTTPQGPAPYVEAFPRANYTDSGPHPKRRI